jgi:AbrB family looped-hinge helix DNA binding protein
LIYFIRRGIHGFVSQRKDIEVETTTTSKGQIVIPSSIRRRLGIKEGTRIRIEENGNEIILKPITREYVHSLRGKFRGKGLMKALMSEKKREREL